MADLSNADPSSPWGYLIAFAIPMIDAFFPAVPSETVVVGLGVLASRNFDQRIVPLVLLVALGAFAGDNICYWLGRRFGVKVAERLLHGAKGKAGRDWAEYTLNNYGMRLLIVARFIPGGRTVVTITAGMTGYPVRRFEAAAGIAAVIWTTYSFGIGVIGGRAFEDNTWAALGLGFGIAAFGTGLVELTRRLLARRHKGMQPPSPLTQSSATSVDRPT